MQQIRKALESRRPLLGVCIMYPSPGVVERIAPDWDWVWIDGQHGQMGYEQTLALVRACDLAQRPALVRVPWNEAGAIGLALDMNPAGVIVPCVETPDEARSAVAAAKFPPLGRRSYGGRRPIDFDGRAYSDTANQQALLVAQIESPQAVEAADAIAALDGVDALFLGPDDVSLRRGYSMTQPRNRQTLAQDTLTVANAARKHGKLLVNVGVGEEMLRACVEVGTDLIVAGGDVAFLATSSKSASAAARAVVAESSPDKSASPNAPSSSPSLY